MKAPVRVRLTLLYSAVTVMTVIVIFGFTFVSLYRSLQQEDIRDLQNRLLGYWAQYQTGGMESLGEELNRDTFLMGDRLGLVRISDPDNVSLFFTWPEEWNAFNPRSLDMRPLDPRTVYELSSPDHDYNLEVAGIWLSEQYFLQLGAANRNRVALMRGLERNFLVIGVTSLLLAFAVGLLITTRSLRPVDRVTAVAREIVQTGRLDRRVEADAGGGELQELVEVINRMLQRIDALVVGLRETVDMVAHDLRTPLTRLRARAELALRNDDKDQAHHALVETIEQSDEILRMVHTLLDITEAESGIMKIQREQFAVLPLVKEIHDLYELVAEEREILLEYSVPDQLQMSGDRVRLRQVVANLVDNGLKYCRHGGTVSITVNATAPAESPGDVTIAVSDTGVGMVESELERMWDRLYRGPVQPEQPGLGLGLSLVRAVVQAHNGTVSADSTPGVGTTVTVTIPAAAHL